MLRIELVLAIALMLSSAALVFAAEPDNECEPAVDAADRLGSDINQNCDYSNTGLNGVLHRALANTEKSSVEKKDLADAKLVPATTSVAVQLSSSVSADNRASVPASLLTSNSFSNSQQFATARFELILKIRDVCIKGFVVDSESYIPSETKSLKLALAYRCL